MTPPRAPTDTSPLPAANEEQVVAYLRGHPGFLQRHADVLVHQTPPSRFKEGGVADLQSYMIERLQHDGAALRKITEELATATRQQARLVRRIHEAALLLLSCRDAAAVQPMLTEDLPNLLDLDVVILGFEPDDQLQPFLGFTRFPPGMVDRVLGLADVVLRPIGGGDPVVFGPAAGLVKAAAVIRLTPPLGPPGLLALGSRDDLGGFGGQGTELLSFLGRVLECCLDHWMAAAIFARPASD